MSFALTLQPSYRYRASWRSRAAALALAIGVTVLIILVLATLGILPLPKLEHQSSMSIFTAEELTPSHTESPKHTERPVAGSAARKSATKKPQPPPAAPVTAPTPKVKVIWLDHDQYAASDIGTITAPPRADDTGSSAGKDQGDVYGPGEGPGGEPLYNAAWYRRPSDAELSYYLPKRAPATGWALIACRTIDHYHVDSCRILGETPGSGFGYAIQQAAWQFLVRPPRLGGKPLVGAWVRIRIDFTPAGATAR